MDFKKLFRPLSIKQFFPWIFFVVLCSILLGIYLSEKISVPNKKDLENCVLSPWSEWLGCEANDCQEIGKRTRTVISGTERCTNQLMVDTRPCSEILNCSDFNCQYTQWTPWSDCPNLCYHNIFDCNTLPNQVRFRNVLRPALPGGLPCDWTTLLEERPCVVQGPCAPDLDCIVGIGETCSECPDEGCTVSGSPFYTLCTRSILQSQSGNGKGCSRDALLFSRTCFLPDCTQSCLSNDYGAFSKCSNPCGPGLFFSSSENDCPTLTTGECNNGTCSFGGFSLSTLTSCSGGIFCPATDLFSYTRCLASGASDPDIDTAQSVSGGVFLGSSSTMICTTGGTDTVFTYSEAFNNCVPVTWDMIGALCLYLCDGRNSITDLSRGYVFPFDDGSLSCPIDLHMLSITDVCPLVNSVQIDRPYGMENFLGLSDNFTNVNDQSFSCPISTDCEYQSYSDAKPWSQCNESCADGGGLRTRTRVILKPETFLGVTCDPLLTVETAPCNLNQLTSATDMWCYGDFFKASEYLCELQASITGSRSMQLLYEEPSNEIFLLDSGAPLTSVSMLSFIAANALQLASYSQLVQYFQEGGQSCKGGWIFNDQVSSQYPLDETQERTCPATVISNPWIYSFQDLIGSYCFYTNSLDHLISLSNVEPCNENYVEIGSVCSRTTLFSCDEGFEYVDGCRLLDSFYNPIFSYTVAASVQQSCSMMPGRQIYAGLPDSNYIWVYGDKQAYYNSFSLEPFFSATQPSMYDSGYKFNNESYSNISCALFEHRTDLVVCSSLSTQNLFTKSNLIDLPCNTARDCSLSAWVPTTKCNACAPPFSYLQTRSIISRATEGGVPCDQFLLTSISACGVPSCNPGGSENACVPEPFIEKSGTAPNSCDLFTRSYPLIENWSYKYIYAIAGIQEIAAVIDMVDQSDMPDELAQALNAQVLNIDGSFSTCIRGLSADGDLTNTFTLTSGGWEPSGCDTDEYVDDQLLGRVGSISRRYWDFNIGDWACGSSCPYLIDTCNFPDLVDGSCSCGLSQQTVTTVWQNWPAGSSLTCNQSGTSAIASKPCPLPITPCPDLLQCPTGCDGTPCGSFSGNGFCYYNTQDNYYECSCTNGSVQQDCSIICQIGSNGLECSGNGSCSNGDGTCDCDPGYFGTVCDQKGYALIGAFEAMPFLQPYTFTQTKNTGTPETIHITATNPLPCDNENNPACEGVTLQSGAMESAMFHPIFEYNNSLTLYSANMCIHSGNGNNDNSMYVPNHLMMYRPRPADFPMGVQCDQLILDRFNILCEFTNDSPLVPSFLVGKRFFTRCFKTINQLSTDGTPENNYTYSRINQYDSNDRPLFKVLSQNTDLESVCIAPSAV